MKKNEPTVSLSITAKNSAEALDFYTKAFGAEELYRMTTPDGGVAHAEFMIGNTRIYLSDESPEWHAVAMPEGGQASCLFAIHTNDCDASFERAKSAGGEALKAPEDQFWGMRTAMIKDPFGYRWSFGQIVEELSPEEGEQRAKAIYAA